LVVLNNNHTDLLIGQSLILEHANHVATSTGDLSKSKHTYRRRGFLGSLLESFSRSLLEIWRRML